MNTLRNWSALVMTLFALTTAAAAQDTTQQISGFVKDANSALVAAAAVTARNIGTGQTRTATANDSGYYVIANIPIGAYEVAAEARSFRKFLQKGVNVSVNAKLTVDITLEAGSISESMTVVESDQAQVEANTGEVGRLVTGAQATQLQLNGRNFAQLLALLPGVSTSNRSSFDLFGGFGSNMSAQTINGGRNYTYSWNIDGADNKDNGGGGNNFVNLNPDALAEFKVLTTNYSAEYGQNAGAVVNLALKSGSKQFHGALYEFVRNDAFDALAFNALQKQKLRFNNFGGNIGGPIFTPRRLGGLNSQRDKLFFFVGVEFKRLRQDQVQTWTVPTLALRNGDFSALPAAQQPRDLQTGQPFPGGIIPANRFSPNARRLIANYPLPNFTGTGGNFVFAPTTPLNTNQYLYKVDYSLSEKHQLAVHYLRDYYTSVQNLAQLVTFDRNIPGTNASAKWTWVKSATTVNTLQTTFTGNVIQQINFQPNPVFISDFSRTGQGINYPQIYGRVNEIPSFNIAGFNGLGVNPRQFQNFNRVFQFKDDLSKVVGNHNLKFGALLMRSRKNQDNQPAINGSFSFATGHALSSGNAFADALLGNFSQYTEADRAREGWFRFSQLEFYAQDNWKATQRLSLDFGLRYQYLQPQYAALNNAVVFDPRFFDPARAPTILASNGQIVAGTGDPVNGLTVGGNSFPEAALQRIPGANDPLLQRLFHDLPKEISRTDYNTLGPRLSFAYDLTGQGDTVVRGGWGLFFERVQGNFIFGRINNPPFIRQSDIFSGNVENPAGGAQRLFPAALTSFDLEVKVPKVQNFSLGVQRKLFADTLLDVTYVGSTGWNQYRALDLNQLPEGTLQRNPGVNANALRPYKGYAGITHYLTGANFNYHSLQVNARKQMRNGGLLNAAYTWSKNLTDASDWNELPLDSYDFKRDYGLSNSDRRHIFVFSYVYELPFWRAGQRWYEKAFGGWQLSGVTTLQAGRPLNLTIAGDRAGTTSGSQRPDLVGDWQEGGGTRGRWFNTAAFAQPALGKFGTLGRNVVIGPGTNNWDASLQKLFRLREGLRLDFRAEIYNLPNHFSYFGVATQLGAANFGQVTSASDPRTIQLGLKLLF